MQHVSKHDKQRNAIKLKHNKIRSQAQATSCLLECAVGAALVLARPQSCCRDRRLRAHTCPLARAGGNSAVQGAVSRLLPLAQFSKAESGLRGRVTTCVRGHDVSSPWRSRSRSAPPAFDDIVRQQEHEGAGGGGDSGGVATSRVHGGPSTARHQRRWWKPSQMR
jgi:hypothetical protein